MMKAKHFLRIVLVGLALILLGACGQKSPDSIGLTWGYQSSS